METITRSSFRSQMLHSFDYNSELRDRISIKNSSRESSGSLLFKKYRFCGRIIILKTKEEALKKCGGRRYTRPGSSVRIDRAPHNYITT